MKRIFLVDDDPTIHAILKLALEHRGWSVIGFESGVGVAARAASELPDLILLDSNMPEMNGEEVLQEVQSQCPHVPVVLLTAETESDIETRLKRAGAMHVLAKPIAPLSIVDTLSALMDWK